MKAKEHVGSLPRRSPQDRRALILNAAREVFADRNYEEVAVSEIVKRAGVAQGTFYLYFPKKQAILSALAEELIAALDAALDRVSAEAPTLIDFLGSMQKVAMQIVRRYSAVLPLLDPEMMFFGADAQSSSPKVHLLRTIERLMQRDQERGLVNPKLNCQIISRLIVSGLDRRGRDCLTGSRYDLKQYTQEMLMFFAAALRP